MLISRKLLLLRRTLGLTQSNLVGKNTISVSALSRIEREDTTIFAEDLINILDNNHITKMKFLGEYSTVEKTVRYYQDQALYYFLNKDVASLSILFNNLEVKSRLLNLLIKEMIRSLKGEKLTENENVKKLLFKLKDYDDNFLWCLLVSLKLYPNDNFAVIVEKIFYKYDEKDVANSTVRLIADIVVAFLLSKANKRSSLKEYGIEVLDSLKTTPNIFLQKLAVQYLVAKRKRDFKTVKWIENQVSIAGLKKEFLQLIR
ncbi:hypothetical protein FP435_03435 [Lactobacillus sp. PV037]|uniref:hypothetical protein n=1 Tax=unclassified Lactobacillus TaxID=2620435 RepID=UPI0022401079|nr:MULTISPECIES: hypothetical protein [unclassified Lactobacillus]QNQ82327.1 hypothetical protein FP433_04395 [Lactobacillus sp. PV012]QNQ83561.1 hypothetical protein FP435_03435 [Lactobacillus sp. PV037]